MSDDRRICLGEITGAHGVRGQVRIKAHTETPEDIAAYGPLEDEAGDRRFELADVRLAKGAVVARIAGVADRSEAEALKGVGLYVDRDRLPDQEDGVWYHLDLVGLEALDTEGRSIGRVVAVHNYGAGDLLEIEPTAGGATVLVPFTEEIVPEIDLGDGRLLIVPPEGLLD